MREGVHSTAQTSELTPREVDGVSPQAATTILGEDGRVLGTCAGPGSGGGCTAATAGGPAPCAGHVLRTQSSGRAGWEMRVPPAVGSCPLLARRVWAKQPGRRWGPAGTTA